MRNPARFNQKLFGSAKASSANSEIKIIKVIVKILGDQVRNFFIL
jgi:hypothetical protein